MATISPLGSLDESGSEDGTAGDSGGDDGHSSAPGDESGTGDGGIDLGPPPVDGPPRIDFLFVIDNSGSMGTAQAALAGGLETFVDGLEAAQSISYRIGVTTTDNGNPWCGSTSPEAGKLELSSCRERRGEFIFAGTPPADVTDVACLDICELENIPVLPTATEVDPQARVRPWIEGGAEGTNLDGVAVADALRCALPQGIAGCGFESPLESMYKAMLRSVHPEEAMTGFIRSNAHLVVVFITDEIDCSYNNEYQSIFFDANMGGNKVFWSDPEAAAPTSAVCWNAGATCTGGPGVYDECHAQDKDVEGHDALSDDQAVLLPVARYRDFLLELEAQKRATVNASVFVFGIAGVPVGYPETPLVFEDGMGVEQLDFGIGPGCSDGDLLGATPPLRLLELAETFDNPVTPNMFSICGDIGGSLSPILQSVLAHVE